MESVIVFKNLSFSYGAFPVLENIELVIEKGEFIGVVGPNGGGKSTLLKIALGLLEPNSGSVTVLGRKASRGRDAIGYVPQRATAVRDFPISVEDTVLLGRLGSTRLIGGYRADDRAAAEVAMDEAQILDIRNRRIGTLSGGQFQRVLIARALAGEPQILMFDEPTANIDPHVEKSIFDLLRQLNKRMTIIVVSHDIGFISQYVTRVACLNKNLVCHKTSALTGETIEEIYGSDVHLIDHKHHLGPEPKS